MASTGNWSLISWTGKPKVTGTLILITCIVRLALRLSNHPELGGSIAILLTTRFMHDRDRKLIPISKICSNKHWAIEVRLVCSQNMFFVDNQAITLLNIFLLYWNWHFSGPLISTLLLGTIPLTPFPRCRNLLVQSKPRFREFCRLDTLTVLNFTFWKFVNTTDTPYKRLQLCFIWLGLEIGSCGIRLLTSITWMIFSQVKDLDVCENVTTIVFYLV